MAVPDAEARIQRAIDILLEAAERPTKEKTKDKRDGVATWGSHP